MTIAIYQEEKADKDKVILRLFEFDGGAVLSAVRRDGTVINNGDILKITPHGELHLFGNINPDLGLALEKSNGSICSNRNHNDHYAGSGTAKPAK